MVATEEGRDIWNIFFFFVHPVDENIPTQNKKCDRPREKKQKTTHRLL